MLTQCGIVMAFFYVTMHYCDSTISQYDVTKEHCDDKTVLYSDGITKLC